MKTVFGCAAIALALLGMSSSAGASTPGSQKRVSTFGFYGIALNITDTGARCVISFDDPTDANIAPRGSGRVVWFLNDPTVKNYTYQFGDVGQGQLRGIDIIDVPDDPDFVRGGFVGSFKSWYNWSLNQHLKHGLIDRNYFINVYRSRTGSAPEHCDVDDPIIANDNPEEFMNAHHGHHRRHYRHHHHHRRR